MSDVTSQLTLGEISMVERISGQSIKQFSNPTAHMGLALTAIAYAIQRRTRPDFTMTDAEAMTFREVSSLIGLDDDDEETPETPEADAPKAPSESSPWNSSVPYPETPDPSAPLNG